MFIVLKIANKEYTGKVLDILDYTESSNISSIHRQIHMSRMISQLTN